MNSCVEPLHVGLDPKLGVTVTVDTIAALVALVPANSPILPVPLTANPVDVLLFVHV